MRRKISELKIPYNFLNQDDYQFPNIAGAGEDYVTQASEDSDEKRQIFDNDLSKLIEKHHFGEYSYGRSYPSKGLFSVSIPDPINPEANFVYNFYTPNERAFIETDNKSILYDSSLFQENEVKFLATVDQTPRFVKLNFKPPKAKDEYIFSTANGEVEIPGAEVEDYFMGNFSDIQENITLEELAEKIIIEGAASNLNFTGVEIVDTFADRKIYTMLSASITFSEISTPLDSPRERAAAFRDKILDNEERLPNPTGNEKIELLDILSETQPEGIALAPHDVEADVAETATDPLTKQSFATKFNNLFFNDIIDFNTRTMNTIYEDELRALRSISSEIQSQALLRATNNNDTSHALPIIPISYRNLEVRNSDLQIMLSDLNQIVDEAKSYIDALNEDDGMPTQAGGGIYQSSGNPEYLTDNKVLLYQAALRGLINPLDFLMNKQNIPNTKIVGYLIQKVEVLADGTTQDFPVIYIDNPRNFSTYIDKEVRYGAVYNYKIRTLALVESCIEVFNTNEEKSEIKIAKYLIASDGTNISAECEEFIPPPPPVRLNAHVDFRYRKPVITWEFPLNKQRDIKRFQIFKRNHIHEAFTLVAEYDFDNSIYRVNPLEVAEEKNLYRLAMPYKRYRDRDFNLDFDEAIYAIASVDAHGMASGYSSQLHIKYDKYTNRLVKNIVSFNSAPKPYPNLYIQEDFFKDLITSSGKKRCNIYFDPEYYKLFKRVNEKIEIFGVDIGTVTKHKNIDYVRTSDTEYNYTFQMINIDLQESKNIKIRIVDKSGTQINVPVSKISRSNLNFEFGTKD